MKWRCIERFRVNQAFAPQLCDMWRMRHLQTAYIIIMMYMHAKEMKFQWSRPHLATSFPKESHLKPLFATASPNCNQLLLFGSNNNVRSQTHGSPYVPERLQWNYWGNGLFLNIAGTLSCNFPHLFHNMYGWKQHIMVFVNMFYLINKYFGATFMWWEETFINNIFFRKYWKNV